MNQDYIQVFKDSLFSSWLYSTKCQNQIFKNKGITSDKFRS
jgi:hypothetical protein